MSSTLSMGRSEPRRTGVARPEGRYSTVTRLIPGIASITCCIRGPPRKALRPGGSGTAFPAHLQVPHRGAFPSPGADAAGRVPERAGRRTDQGSVATRHLAARSLGGLLDDGRGCHPVCSHRRTEWSALEHGSIRRPWRCGHTGGATPPASRAAGPPGAGHASDRPLIGGDRRPAGQSRPGRGVRRIPEGIRPEPSHSGFPAP